LRNVRGIALVIVEHKLNRPPQQAALRIDVVAPDLQSGEHLLADRRHAAGQCHAQANPDRLGGLRRIWQEKRAGDEQRRVTRSIPNARDAHVLLPVRPFIARFCFWF